jgi:hypothetical protein
MSGPQGKMWKKNLKITKINKISSKVSEYVKK